jgi:hypothetical protein
MDPQSRFTVNRLDIILLGTISLGVLAWLGRNHLFGTSSIADNNSSSAPSTPLESERNFVKVMKEQVTLHPFLFYQTPYLPLSIVGATLYCVLWQSNGHRGRLCFAVRQKVQTAVRG